MKIKVEEITEQTSPAPAGAMKNPAIRRHVQQPGRTAATPPSASTHRARFVRLELPSAGLTVVRDDASSVAVRSTTVRNPTDADVSIPANGFNLVGTLTTPPAVADRLRSPASS